MHTHSNNFLRAATRVERGYRLPQATARRVAELAGFRSDRELADNWINLAHAVGAVLNRLPHTANSASSEVSQ